MSNSRGKKAVINTSIALLQEIVAVICGFILPRLILKSFGSAYNGLTTSITQFLSCAVLLRSGIGGATRAALYKPLADHDMDQINAIMAATNLFMRKIAFILAGLILAFACVYPFFVIDEFNWFFSFSLFVIIGLSTFAESFFGITYLILLQADQKLYIPSIVHIVVYILNTLVSAILIHFTQSIHLVKLGSAMVFVIYPATLNIYVKRKYKINVHVKPNNQAIGQRWDAFWHQVANFVMNNTDTIILTIFSNMTMVSVYSVYNLVINGLKKLILTFTNGLEAAFGNMIVVGKKSILEENFYLTEYIMFSISTIINSCAYILILAFIKIYTKGINDTDYIQPIFAIIIILAHYFNCIRQPYQLVVQAAGHYQQTKNGAIIEPILNIIISVILVIKFGLVGVAIGTLVATLFRTFQYSIYVSKNLIFGCCRSMIAKCILSFCEFFVIYFIGRFINLGEPASYLSWILQGIVAAVIATVIVIVGSLVFYRKEFLLMTNKIMHLAKK